MNICVFCGSSVGTGFLYSQAAKELGVFFAKNSHRLVYGGGNVGLMGIVADAVMENQGEVIGVIPDFLVKREVAHRGISSLEIVTSMHARKQRMADLSDAFIAMPGGWGTLDELAEILTWKQLGIIHQPIGVLNIDGFFNPLITQMRSMVSAGFLQQQNFNSLIVMDSVEKLLNALMD